MIVIAAIEMKRLAGSCAEALNEKDGAGLQRLFLQAEQTKFIDVNGSGAELSMNKTLGANIPDGNLPSSAHWVKHIGSGVTCK